MTIFGVSVHEGTHRWRARAGTTVAKLTEQPTTTPLQAFHLEIQLLLLGILDFAEEPRRLKVTRSRNVLIRIYTNNHYEITNNSLF